MVIRTCLRQNLVSRKLEINKFVSNEMKLHQKLFWLLVFSLPLQLGRHFWPPSSLILGLRVDYLAPTVYLTDILVVGILGLWGIEKMANGQWLMVNWLKRYWWVLTIFIYLLINALLAQNQGAALYKFVKIIELTLLGLYVAKNTSIPKESREAGISQYPSIFISSEARNKGFLISLSLAVIYSSLIALAQFIKQASLGGVFWWLGERTFNVATPGIAKAIINGQLVMRPYGTFPHPNVLAGFVLVALILISSPVENLSLLKKGVRLSAFILGILAIVVSFSRSVWLVGPILLLPFLWRRKMKKKLFWLTTGVLLVVLTMFFYLLPHFSTNEAFFQRWQLMKTAGLMIKNAPLAGVGLNNFIVRLPDYWPVTGFTYWLQPVHNIYLLIATETGLVGLVVFLWLLILVFKRLLKSSSMSNFPLFRASARNKLHLLMALMAILLLGLTDHYWLTLQQGQLLLALGLGLAWSSKI